MTGWCSRTLTLVVCACLSASAAAQSVSAPPASPVASSGLRLWPFNNDAERLVQLAHAARLRLDFATASTLLDEAAGKDPHVEPAVVHERGLLARDRGDLEHALALLKRAADLEPTLSARVDQAGVLVQLGRWPEAVVTLRQAFDERGTSLPVDQVTSDRRFVKLATLKPYMDVMEAARAEQAGPFGRVVLRLERLQASASAAEHGVQRLAAWLSFFRDLATETATGVLLLIFLGLFLTFGVNQLGLLRPPWTLGVGMLLASLAWASVAHVVTEGQGHGRDTMVIGCGIVGLVWGVVAGIRLAWRRWQRYRRGAGDPFAPQHLPDTLLLVDEVSRLGHRIVGSRKREQRVLVEALRQAGETLRERLDKGA